jgi:hypothetical protein
MRRRASSNRLSDRHLLSVDRTELANDQIELFFRHTRPVLSGSLVAALIWASVLFFLFPRHSVIHQALAVFVLAGVCLAVHFAGTDCAERTPANG